jgi:hypothetical protein
MAEVEITLAGPIVHIRGADAVFFPPNTLVI